MNFIDMAYIPLIAVVNLAVIYGWQKWARKRSIGTLSDWGVVLLCSLLNTWGLDTLQRLVVTYKWADVFKVSLGGWLLFTAASSLKNYRLNNWSVREFWLDYGGDLLSYFFIGAGIYACT